MSFAADVNAWVEKALLAPNKSVCAAFEYLGTQSVDLTKDGKINIGGFSNGDIANNWHVSVGGLTMVIPNGPDLSGAASLARIRSLEGSLPFYKKDNTVYLTNVMNYSYRASFIGWLNPSESTNGWHWSGRVGPYGFVNQAILNTKGKYM